MTVGAGAIRTVETGIGLGFKKQTDISTASLIGVFQRIKKVNTAFAGVDLVTETDEAEIGKGHEFATAVYPVNWDAPFTLEKYTSSEFACWAWAFVLGKVVKSGGPSHWVYTMTPLDPATEGSSELPYFSYLEQLRPTIPGLDRLLIGNALEEVSMEFGSGPGRANSKMTATAVGSGHLLEPSTYELPATPLVEHLLPSASLTLVSQSDNYVTTKKIISGKAGWKNNINLADGFYPGSGFQTPGDATSGAVRGRLEVGGKRTPSLSIVGRFDKDSTERAKLASQSTGTAVITLSNDANNSIELTFEKVSYKKAVIGESGDWVTVQIEVQPQMHSSNGLLTVVGKCDIDAICAAP